MTRYQVVLSGLSTEDVDDWADWVGRDGSC